MMQMLTKRLLLLLAALPLLASCDKAPNEPTRYAILYGKEATAEQLSKYDLLVFQPYNHTLLQHLTPKQEALMYVNLGESYPGILSPEEEARLAVDYNEIWKNHIIDIRQPEWEDIFINRFVAEAVAKGFNGVMLDTVDSSLHLETQNPEKFKGMTTAALRLIRAIKAKHPQMKVMLNRGFAIWPAAAPSIDMVLIEDIFTAYDFGANRPQIQQIELTKQHLARISLLRGTNPHIKFFCVEYWDMNDKRGVAKLYELQRKHGLSPYVATPSLEVIHTEPTANELLTGASNA